MASIDERTPLLQGSISTATVHTLPPSLFVRLGAYLGAIQEGSLPSASQCCGWIDALLHSQALAYDPSSSQSASAASNGTDLIVSVRNFLVALKQFIAHRLSQNALQDFVWHSNQSRIAVDIQAEQVPDAKGSLPNAEEAQRDAATLLFALNTLIRLLLSNVFASSQSILDDFFYLTRSTLSDVADQAAQVAGEVADTLRPDEPLLSDLEGPVRLDKAEEQASNLVQTLEEGKEVLLEAGADLTTLHGRAALAAEKDVQRVALERLQKLAARIREHPDASRSAIILLDLLHKYVSATQETVEVVEEAVTEPQIHIELSDEEQHAQDALKAFMLLLEDLAQMPLAPIIATSKDVFKDIQNNHALSNYLDDLGNYVRQLLSDPSYAQSEASFKRAKELYESAETLLQAHADWKVNLATLFQQVEDFYQALASNPDLDATKEASGGVTYALTALLAQYVPPPVVCVVVHKSSRGPRAYKHAIYTQLFDIFLPRLATVLSYFPVPRAEFTSPALDLLLDDFLITEINLLPTYFRMHQSTDLLVQREADYQAQETTISMTGANSIYIRGLKFSIESVSFWLKRKNTWFPCFREEYGLLALSLLKRGLELSVDFELNEPVLLAGSSGDPLPENGSFATISSVVVALPDIDIQLTQTKHRFFFWLLRPAVKLALRIGVKYILSSQIKTALESLDRYLYKIHARAQPLLSRGRSIAESYLVALSSVQEESASAQEAVSAERGQEGILASAHLTSHGVIIDPPDADFTVSVGGTNLLPEAHGPERSGPHGSHGGGSFGRIAAQADQLATDGAVRASQQAAQNIADVQATVDILTADQRVLKEAASKVRSADKDYRSWRSSSFNL